MMIKLLLSEAIYSLTIGLLFNIYVVRTFPVGPAAEIISNLAVMSLILLILQFGSQARLQTGWGEGIGQEALENRSRSITNALCVAVIAFLAVMLVVLALDLNISLVYLYWSAGLFLFGVGSYVYRLRGDINTYVVLCALYLAIVAMPVGLFEFEIIERIEEVVGLIAYLSLLSGILIVLSLSKFYKLTLDVDCFLRHLKFSLPITISYLIYFLASRGQIIIIGNLMTPNDLLILSICLQFSAMLVMFIGIYSKVVYPELVRDSISYFDLVEKFNQRYIILITLVWIVIVCSIIPVFKYIYNLALNSEAALSVFLILTASYIYNLRSLKNLKFNIIEKNGYLLMFVIVYFLAFYAQVGIFYWVVEEVDLIYLSSMFVTSSILIFFLSKFFYEKSSYSR